MAWKKSSARLRKKKRILQLALIIFLFATLLYLLKDTFTPYRDLLKNEATYTGALESWSWDGENIAETKYSLNTDKGAINLEFPESVEIPAPGSNVTVTGKLSDSTLTVSSLQMGDLQPAKAASRKALVILFNFSDDTERPFTKDEFRGVMNTVAWDYNNFSYRNLTLSYDIFGWFTIDSTNDRCTETDHQPNQTWKSQAFEKAKNAGASSSGYNMIIYVFPTQSSCNRDGHVWYGMKARDNSIWINGSKSETLIEHEIGHWLGLGHVKKDSYDMMGEFQDESAHAILDRPDTNAAHKDSLEWIPNKLTAAQSQTVTIQDATSPSSGIQLVKVSRKAGGYYYLTYRYVTGLSEYGHIVKKLYIHHYLSNNEMELDGVLIPGQTFDDEYTAIKLESNSVQSGYLTLTVRNFAAQTTGVPGPILATSTPSLVKIAGHVRSTDGTPIEGVKVNVKRRSDGKVHYDYTDAGGGWDVDGFLNPHERYDVYPDSTAPLRFTNPPRTTTATYARDFCRDPRIDVPLGSPSYTCQNAGVYDCASKDDKGIHARCDFAYQQIATPTPYVPAVCTDMYVSKVLTNSTHTYTTKSVTLSSGESADIYMKLQNPIGSVQAWVRTYNLDNLNSGVPRAAYLNPNSKPDGYAAMTTLSGNPSITQFSPQAGYPTSAKEMHWHIRYDQLKKADVNWNNQVIRRIQFNGFANSSSKPSCVVTVNLN